MASFGSAPGVNGAQGIGGARARQAARALKEKALPSID